MFYSLGESLGSKVICESVFSNVIFEYKVF